MVFLQKMTRPVPALETTSPHGGAATRLVTQYRLRPLKETFPLRRKNSFVGPSSEVKETKPWLHTPALR